MKLQDGEKIILENGPEKAILGIWFFTKCIMYTVFSSFMTFWVFGFFGGIFAVVTETKDFNPMALGGGFTLLVVVIIFPLSFFYISILRKTFHYIITNRRCIFQGGIIKRVERSIPFHKITDVERSENIFERFLGISRVKVFTPGTASMAFNAFGRQASEITYEGLSDAEEMGEIINDNIRKFREIDT